MIRNFARRFCTVNPLAIQGSLSFEVITKEKDAHRFLELLTEKFSRSEGASLSMNLSKHDLFTLFDPLREYFLEHQTALIARDNSINDIVSGFMGLDYFASFPPGFESRMTPKALEVVEILDGFKNKSFEKGHTIKQMNTYFYILAGFTADAYEGRGIYRMLSNLAEKRARERGFKYMMRETTNSRLEQAFAAQGYQTLSKESLDELSKNQGEKGFYWTQMQKSL